MSFPTTDDRDKVISPDQVLAYAITSETACEYIYERMWFMFYDGRYMEPKVWAFVKYCHTRKRRYKWILEKACQVSIQDYKKTGHTSGILKVWTIYKYLNWPLPADIDFNKVFNIYYEKEHPIHTGVYLRF